MSAALARLTVLLEAASWTTAKTRDHQWTEIGSWDAAQFREAVAIIKAEGYWRLHGRTRFRTVHVGDHIVWILRGTRIINRAIPPARPLERFWEQDD